MKQESLAYLVAGTCFGILMGWIVGSQQTRPQATPAQAAESAAPASAPAQAPTLDVARVNQLEQQAKAEPTNASVREELGNAYFDAERYDQAATWYEASLKIDPKNVNVSTDLAVAYYSTNQVDRAIAQLDRSLKIDPQHLKTLLNKGIVLAMGKNDFAGAQSAWERVIAIAPTSEEARRARLGLDGIKASHPDVANAPAAGGTGK